MNNIKPLGDRILVKILEDDEQVKDGIIIPDSAKEKSQEAEVVALGTGKKDSDGKAQEFDVNVEEEELEGITTIGAAYDLITGKL